MDSIWIQNEVRNNSNDIQEFCKDLQKWSEDMKKKDESLKHSLNNTQTPLPRSNGSKESQLETEKCKTVQESKMPKRLKPCDYAAWDKFDADAICAKLDKENDAEKSSEESELSDEIDESTIDLANAEKENGNCFVKKQQWNKAIDCYTKAIEFYAYDPIYYANRSLCYLKMENYKNAESDCTTALQLDKKYVKAYQRRAAAREKLNQLSEARSDLLRILELEPKNMDSKAALIRVEKKLENIKEEKPDKIEQPRPVSKFTLSRQNKHTSTNTQIKAEKYAKDVPAIREHVLERATPSCSNVQQKQIHHVENTKDSSSNAGGKKIKNLLNVTSSRLYDTDDALINRHNRDDIQLFQSVHKSPQTRSKKPLKRIEIVDVNLDTEKQFLSSKLKIMEIQDKAKLDHEEEDTREIFLQEKTKHDREQPTENINVKSFTQAKKFEINTDSFDQLNLTVPTTAVQFYSGWRNVQKNKDWRKSYLQKINPKDFPIIFKESLESNVFSQIIETLSDFSCSSDILVYDYLLGLTEVKRFGALVMFMSSKDKKSLLSVVDYLKQENKYMKEDVDKIINLYEL